MPQSREPASLRSLVECKSSDRSGGRHTVTRTHPHQHPKDDRYKKKGGHVTKQMTPFRRVLDSLPGHDGSMHHAGPYGEPDDAFVRVRITRGHQKEYAERRVNSNDHHQVVGVALTPSPARGPNYAQRIDAQYESKADDDKRDAEIKQTIDCRHCAPSAFGRFVRRSLNFDDGEVSRAQQRSTRRESRRPGKRQACVASLIV